ncbi:MAG: DNA-binding transcriptional LysR family regulator [Flavobacteriales bacterium]|jgi:DNA-binding transcriptional LysR family regulator
MDKLRAMRLFVRLAELGSFTRVAEQTNASKSMISKEISRLEDSLGARLLHRSTRNVQLTQLGKGYLQRTREILSKLDDADVFVQGSQKDLRGRLKINIPMALGIGDLSTVFASFMLAFPDIELDLHLGDESIDLIEQGFDLGLTLSSKQLDSNYVGRALSEFSYRVCASPDYIDQNSKIKTPRDLIDHNCFIYSYFKGKNVWPIDDGVTVKGNMRVNSTVFMMESIKRGLGIGFIPDFVCRQALEAGEVIEILENTRKPKLTLYALYPTRHFVPASLLQCIEFLQIWFRDNLIEINGPNKLSK